jgi:uncharacterized protein YejL (UPF0352 family)
MAGSAPADPVDQPASGEPPPPAASVQAPPAAETPAPAVPAAEPQGPIPYERHQRILANAREKAAGEIVQRFQTQYGAHVELGNRIASDPVGTVVGLIESLAQHPEHGNAVISALARTLGSRRNGGGDAEPQADLQTPDGTLVYSAPQLTAWHQWQQRQFQQQIDQQLQPLQQREQERVAQERVSQARAEAMDRMGKVIAPYKELLPDFDRHKPALLAKSKALLAEGHDAQTALGLAVMSLMRDTVLPATTAQSQQSLMAQAVAKATGSTNAPGTSVAAPAGRPRDFAEAFGRVKV